MPDEEALMGPEIGMQRVHYRKFQALLRNLDGAAPAQTRCNGIQLGNDCKKKKRRNDYIRVGARSGCQLLWLPPSGYHITRL